ncbi:uncharacterized protein LOC110402101 isoform X2 [Numida meleagris]|nr:uncharacterized protein LOC110402101 isoform X2 [Numida meleagris]
MGLGVLRHGRRKGRVKKAGTRHLGEAESGLSLAQHLPSAHSGAGSRRQRRAEQRVGQRRAPGRAALVRGKAAAALTHSRRRRPGPARTPSGLGPARGDFRGLPPRSGPHTASSRHPAQPEGLWAAPPRRLPQETRMGPAASRPRPRPPPPGLPTPDRAATLEFSASRRPRG